MLTRWYPIRKLEESFAKFLSFMLFCGGGIFAVEINHETVSHVL
jgi:hypothetical protein